MPGVFRLPSASTRCVSKGLSRSRTDNFVVVRAGHQRGDASLWQLYRNRLLPAPTARLGCSDAATAKIAEPEHQLSPTERPRSESSEQSRRRGPYQGRTPREVSEGTKPRCAASAATSRWCGMAPA